MIRLLGLSCLVPFAAFAEPRPAVLALMPYMDITATCFDGAEDRAEATACIGQGSSICMESDPNGYTTLGMAFCARAESEAWDRLLNRDYAEMIAAYRRIDADTAKLFPEFANREESLRNAQRAWIPSRDADCSLAYAIWGEGSMRHIEGAGCHMRKTAERAIYLRFLEDHIR